MASSQRNSPVSFAFNGSHFRDSDADSSSSPACMFTDVAHSKDFISAVKFLRQNEDFCDIVLQVGAASITAHKVVLAACSPYFRAMFTGE